MQIQQLRNATILLTLGKHRLLVDPMLSPVGAFPGFKMFGGGRKNNPLVPLPEGAMSVMEEATAVLITHEHPDHFDPPALAWVKERNLPVWSNAVDAPNLQSKGLHVEIVEDGQGGMRCETVFTRHGHGLSGWIMGPVAGYFLAHPDEPSVYITGDSVWTPAVDDALKRLKPDVVVAPAGSANFGLGKDILFSQKELMTLVSQAAGKVVFNHLESLDHCLTTRAGLRKRMEDAGFGERVFVPEDGESLIFSGTRTFEPELKSQPTKQPGFQKWLTAKMAGT